MKFNNKKKQCSAFSCDSTQVHVKRLAVLSSLCLQFAEKEMAPHSKTLAWKIPWTEEPGRLQSMGSLGVGYKWATSLSCIGEGNGNPLQCSCLENPRDRGAWWAAVHGVTQSRTWLKWLSSSSRSNLYLLPHTYIITAKNQGINLISLYYLLLSTWLFSGACLSQYFNLFIFFMYKNKIFLPSH